MVACDNKILISLLQAGDLILADKGFLLYDILPQGALLNLPAFLRGKKQLTTEEAVFSHQLSHSRIHVERAIERLRNFRIVDKLPAKQRPFISLVVQVCSALVNLQSPIIAGIFDK